MSYGADFATADPANAPLDAPLLIGADPLVWGAILLALLVAAMIGWLMGSGARSKRGDAAGAIWEAIDEAAKAAMKADTDTLPAQAADLHRVLRARLGRTLDFGGELTGCVDALALALKGDLEDKADHGGHDHAPEKHEPEADHEAAAPASPAAANVTISIHPPTPGRPPHPSPKPGKRPMTLRERNAALRLAVAAFNDYWRHRAARVSEMDGVVAELSDPGPRRPSLSHGGGHH
ncbi:hypothetical protein [Brevundimonas sp.]|uniref:hypothetical protein n=1 Tax=Brevundimonas sp. TaxID=1871086 RepID=UPI002D62AC5D|nr:hypothetical protein [Brevundimonas sp.]HYC98958.1 hypothetical protein [Brevundimonas sp.]